LIRCFYTSYSGSRRLTFDFDVCVYTYVRILLFVFRLSHKRHIKCAMIGPLIFHFQSQVQSFIRFLNHCSSPLSRTQYKYVYIRICVYIFVRRAFYVRVNLRSVETLYRIYSISFIPIYVVRLAVNEFKVTIKLVSIKWLDGLYVYFTFLT